MLLAFDAIVAGDPGKMDLFLIFAIFFFVLIVLEGPFKLVNIHNVLLGLGLVCLSGSLFFLT